MYTYNSQKKKITLVKRKERKIPPPPKKKVLEKDDLNSTHNDLFISGLQEEDWVKFKSQEKFFLSKIKKINILKIDNLIAITATETVIPDLRVIWKYPKKPDILGVQ